MCLTQAGIAQSVEHFTRNEGVVSSSLISSFFILQKGILHDRIYLEQDEPAFGVPFFGKLYENTGYRFRKVQ